MIRLHVTTEGATERNFIKRILAPHLAEFGVFADARDVMTSRDKRLNYEYRGGLNSYGHVKRDISTWIKQDGRDNCWFTTMFDLYGLPRDFPDFGAIRASEPYERVKTLERALKNDLNHPRFMPYIQLHEFEALLFTDIGQLDWEYLEHERQIANLVQMARTTEPELINDGRQTAPSKRIIREIPEFDKATSGVIVAERIGLANLRQGCPHFNEWVASLELLGDSS